MITGKVAAIVDDSSVVINVGEEHGVKLGMKFQAVFKTPRIVDPDDPENVLDGLLFTIAELHVNSVLAKFAYCKIFNPYSRSGWKLEKLFETVEPKVSAGAKKLVSPDDLKIKVGTAVRELTEEKTQ